MTAARADAARLDGRRSTGVWGGVAGVVVLGTLLAYLLYASLYLAVSTDPWPPEPHAPPPLLGPGVILGVLALSVLPAVRLGRPVEAGLRRWTVEALTAVLVVTGAGVLVAGAAVVGGMDLVPSVRAYDAAVATLHAFWGVVTAAGVAIAAVTGWEAHRLGPHPWVAAARVVTSVWWLAVVAGWVAIAAVAYGWPQVA